MHIIGKIGLYLLSSNVFNLGWFPFGILVLINQQGTHALKKVVSLLTKIVAKNILFHTIICAAMVNSKSKHLSNANLLPILI